MTEGSWDSCRCEIATRDDLRLLGELPDSRGSAFAPFSALTEASGNLEHSVLPTYPDPLNTMIRVVALKRMSLEFGIAALVATMLILTPLGCSAAPLAGSEWWPTSISGTEMPQEGEMFVRFEDDGKLSGNGGCNRFFSTYKVTAELIEFGPIGATRRACQDPIGLNERRLFEALGQARRFQRSGTELSLFDEAGTLLANLRQADAD